MKHTALYVAIGLQESDPGYAVVSSAVESLGESVQLGPAIWHVKAIHTLQEAFRHINNCMMDRRIDGEASLLIIDPGSESASWHLRQPLSDLLRAQWGYQNNLFISFPWNEGSSRAIVDCITELGPWAPISKTTWYVSTPYSSKEAFHYVLGQTEGVDQFCVLDSLGNLAIWQEGARAPISLRSDRAPIYGQRAKTARNARRTPG